MEIPIYIDGSGEAAGTLRICRRNGILLDGRLPDPGRVVRLRVYGEREFYLGVPVPAGDGTGTLRLTRRLTPSEARRFPQKPAYAGERPLPRAEPAPEPARRVLWLGGRPHYF